MARVLTLMLVLPAVLAAVNTCKPRRTIGCACAGNGENECVIGASCIDKVCVSNAGVGEACTDGVNCALGLACSAALATCAPLPKEGEDCAMGRFGPSICATPETLGCIGATDKCGPLPKLDEPCARGKRCAAGLACDITVAEEVCRPLKKVGEPCGSDEMCDSTAFCNFFTGKCATKFVLGTACSAGNECGAGLDCQGKCVKMPSNGQNCVEQCVDPDNFVCDAQLTGTCPSTSSSSTGPAPDTPTASPTAPASSTGRSSSTGPAPDTPTASPTAPASSPSGGSAAGTSTASASGSGSASGGAPSSASGASGGASSSGSVAPSPTAKPPTYPLSGAFALLPADTVWALSVALVLLAL